MSAPSLSRRRLSRRRLLAGGSLVLGFSLLGPRASLAQTVAAGGSPKAPDLPGSLKLEPMLDAWIRVDADGGITVFTGKAELGQGIKTALIQIAAEQMEIDLARCSILTAGSGANLGVTGCSVALHALRCQLRGRRHGGDAVDGLVRGGAA